MKSLLVLENIRSAYNVGNLIRTADALGRQVILSWYTPHPEQEMKVKKTSLGAEETVALRQFRNPSEAMIWAKEKNYFLIAGERTPSSISLENISSHQAQRLKSDGIALVLWNEKTWVLEETLRAADLIVYIPMAGMKESLNVWQAGAILMREINRRLSDK